MPLFEDGRFLVYIISINYLIKFDIWHSKELLILFSFYVCGFFFFLLFVCFWGFLGGWCGFFWGDNIFNSFC